MEFLEKVEQCGKWPQQACTSDVLPDPEECHELEADCAFVPTFIRWWEALRAPEVAKWQQKYRVEWDATDGRNGGAQRTVWEVLMEMERFNGNAKKEDQGSVAMVLDLAKAFGRVSVLVVWAWATRRMCGRAAADHHGHPARVQVELLALRIVLQDALSEVIKNYSPLKLWVFCG